jgi:uncharacterized protein (TIGR02646 family)
MIPSSGASTSLFVAERGPPVLRIIKGFEPVFLFAWRHGQTEDWRPSWGALDSADTVKKQLKEFLCSEQRFVCCYCEVRVEPTETKSHIEHLDSRSEHGDLDVTYQNLLASCMRKGTCGDGKKNEQLPVTPLDEDCARAFRHHSDGTVKPFGGFGRPHDAEEALRVLKLNKDAVLVAKRRAILETVDAMEDPERRWLIDDIRRRPEKAYEFESALRQNLDMEPG